MVRLCLMMGFVACDGYKLPQVRYSSDDYRSEIPEHPHSPTPTRKSQLVRRTANGLLGLPYIQLTAGRDSPAKARHLPAVNGPEPFQSSELRLRPWPRNSWCQWVSTLQSRLQPQLQRARRLELAPIFAERLSFVGPLAVQKAGGPVSSALCDETLKTACSRISSDSRHYSTCCCPTGCALGIHRCLKTMSAFGSCA